MTFGTTQTCDLLAPAKRPLGEGTPSSELPRTSLRRVVVGIERFELRGVVSNDDLSPRDVHVALAGGLNLDSPFDLVIDEEGLGAIALDTTLALDATLFDGVDFGALADEDLDTTNPDGVLGDAVLTGLGNADVSVRVEKR